MVQGWSGSRSRWKKVRFCSITLLWAGYISRIYPESAQELNQILDPFWFLYLHMCQSFHHAEIEQRILCTFDCSLSISRETRFDGPCTDKGSDKSVVNKPEKSKILIEFLGTIRVNFANAATPFTNTKHNTITSI